MQIFALPRRTLVSAFLSIPLGFTTPYLHGADLPVKQIVLYKHGIGYFERQGAVPEGQEAHLSFKNADMNDILKSLIVTDNSGRHVTGIRYDSNETLDQRLERFPFKIGNQELVSTFLDRLKGASVELKSGEHTARGVIMSARAVETGGDTEKHTVREQLTLLLDSGEVATDDLGALGSFRLLDSPLQEQLKQYLQALAQSTSQDKRNVYIDSTGHGDRNLRVSYIAPVAIWKSSYRLSLDAPNSVLEGWAIVDNTTDEDWNGVQLSVVSGRPISFISRLDTPRYGQRPFAELPEDRAAGPEVYGGTVTLGQTAEVVGGVLGGVPAAAPPPPAFAPKQFMANRQSSINVDAAAPKLQEYSMIEPSSVQGATGSALGELFEYSFAGPVTIRKNQSAMLPFLQDKIAARKLLVYTERDGEHPVNAAEITNNTAKTLDGGPLTVFESGAYAGEALVETFKAGDKRLIGYAVDYGTRITTAFDTGQRDIREVHATHGVLTLHYGEHQTKTYTIRNVDAKPKTLLVQQDKVEDYLVLSPQPVERTANAYRFEVKLPSNGSQTLKVEQERVYVDTTVVTDATPDVLLTIVQNKQLSENGRKQLQSIIALKSQLAELNRNLEAVRVHITDVTADQTRLRQNIDSLNRVTGQEDQVRKYSSRLSDNEAQLAQLRDQQRDLNTRRASVESEIRNAIDRLEF